MIFWKIYFYFVFGIVLFGLVLEEYNTMYSYVSAVLTMIGIYGLFLYVFKKKLFMLWFWKFYFVYFLIANFYPNMPGNVDVSYFDMLMTFISAIPFIIALFSIAFLQDSAGLEEKKGCASRKLI